MNTTIELGTNTTNVAAGCAQCRICLEADEPGGAAEVTASAGMIAPCGCRGSMQYVHAECLNTWRRTTTNPLAYYRCEHCLTVRHLSLYISKDGIISIIYILEFVMILLINFMTQFYRHSERVPVVEVSAGLLEIWADHRAWEQRERQREVVLLGLALLVLATVGLCTAHALLALVPSVSPVWLVFVPLDLCALLFVALRYTLSALSSPASS